MSKILSIVIPVFNNLNFTKSCLIDLSKLDNNHEIIVVDNASTDGTVNFCLEFQKILSDDFISGKNVPELKYFLNSENLGFAKACNRGFAESLGTNIMFLNNDIKVEKDYNCWTTPIISHCEKGKICAAGYGVLDKNFNFKFEEKPDPGDKYSEKEIRQRNELIKIARDSCVESDIFYLSGWCIASSKKNWEKLILENEIGPFSSEFGLAYFEDDDLSIRAVKKKMELFVQWIPVYHFGRMTSKKVGMSKLFAHAQEIFINKWRDKI